jgi:hypothetical protein
MSLIKSNGLKSGAAILAAFVALTLWACRTGKGEIDGADSTHTNNQAGVAAITFDYTKQSGSASNQFAVWIEDKDGAYIKTLYATKYTAQGGFKVRPDSIPIWTAKSGIVSMEKSKVDAISSATPRTGKLSYKWDLTDRNGSRVPAGEYKFIVEGTLRWKNQVLYTGVIPVGDTPATVQPEAKYTYEASNNQGALSAGSPESSMIKNVTASFVPG